MKTLIVILASILSIPFSNWLEIDSSNEVKIAVEYNENLKCTNCPKWILIEGNYKNLNRKNAKRIYIQNFTNLKTNELDYLFEKQKPLTLELNGKFSKSKINGYKIFVYSKYVMVEY